MNEKQTCVLVIHRSSIGQYGANGGKEIDKRFLYHNINCVEYSFTL